VILHLFSSGVLEGHDAYSYLPRLVEFHENVMHGILLPRWAPDLGRGYGQPLFIFRPPLLYWMAEAFHLLGFNPLLAINLAASPPVVLSAIAMFLLGRFYFGATGGWLASAAYLYAPYYAVDLYVRSALEESTALPFLVLTLYGFGAYARSGQRHHWLV